MITVGFIGLGAMGLPMAKNLVARGYTVRGYDIIPAAVEAFAQAGGQPATAAAEAAAGADILVTIVLTAAQVETVLFADGALAAAAPGAVVIQMATCAPAVVEPMAARVVATGRGFVDAPCSGGHIGAAAGTLTVMAAAPPATIAAARPILEVFADKIYVVGDKPGQGSTVKICNQLLVGVHIAVAAEAISLGAKIGVDLEAMLKIVGGSAAQSWMLNERSPRMLEPDPPVKATIDILVKDLGIVLDAGRQARAALPFAALAHQLYLAVRGSEGPVDDSQVIRFYRAVNRT
jgi:3-hydroxyisobutyrate dehydrogenase